MAALARYSRQVEQDDTHIEFLNLEIPQEDSTQYDELFVEGDIEEETNITEDVNSATNAEATENTTDTTAASPDEDVPSGHAVGYGVGADNKDLATEGANGCSVGHIKSADITGTTVRGVRDNHEGLEDQEHPHVTPGPDSTHTSPSSKPQRVPHPSSPHGSPSRMQVQKDQPHISRHAVATPASNDEHTLSPQRSSPHLPFSSPASNDRHTLSLQCPSISPSAIAASNGEHPFSPKHPSHLPFSSLVFHEEHPLSSPCASISPCAAATPNDQHHLSPSRPSSPPCAIAAPNDEHPLSSPRPSNLPFIEALLSSPYVPPHSPNSPTLSTVSTPQPHSTPFTVSSPTTTGAIQLPEITLTNPTDFFSEVAIPPAPVTDQTLLSDPFNLTTLEATNTQSTFNGKLYLPECTPKHQSGAVIHVNHEPLHSHNQTPSVRPNPVQHIDSHSSNLDHGGESSDSDEIKIVSFQRAQAKKRSRWRIDPFAIDVDELVENRGGTSPGKFTHDSSSRQPAEERFYSEEASEKRRFMRLLTVNAYQTLSFASDNTSGAQKNCTYVTPQLNDRRMVNVVKRLAAALGASVSSPGSPPNALLNTWKPNGGFDFSKHPVCVSLQLVHNQKTAIDLIRAHEIVDRAFAEEFQQFIVKQVKQLGIDGNEPPQVLNESSQGQNMETHDIPTEDQNQPHVSYHDWRANTHIDSPDISPPHLEQSGEGPIRQKERLDEDDSDEIWEFRRTSRRNRKRDRRRRHSEGNDWDPQRRFQKKLGWNKKTRVTRQLYEDNIASISCGLRNDAPVQDYGSIDARMDDSYDDGLQLPSSNKGFTLLQRMGWRTGDTLGARSGNGLREPIQPRGLRYRAGVGSRRE